MRHDYSVFEVWVLHAMFQMQQVIIVYPSTSFGSQKVVAVHSCEGSLLEATTLLPSEPFVLRSQSQVLRSS